MNYKDKLCWLNKGRFETNNISYGPFKYRHKVKSEMGFLNVNNTVILHSAVFVLDLEFMNSWMFMNVHHEHSSRVRNGLQ